MAIASNTDLVKRFDLDSRTPEERKEILSRAGINSGKSRRKRADLKKCLVSLMESDIPDTSDYLEKVKQSLIDFGIEATEDMTYGAAVCASMLKRAIGGNVKAAEFVRDTAGLNPDLMLKKEALRHQKKMDRLRLGQEEIKKADVGPLIAALTDTNAEDS